MMQRRGLCHYPVCVPPRSLAPCCRPDGQKISIEMPIARQPTEQQSLRRVSDQTPGVQSEGEREVPAPQIRICRDVDRGGLFNRR